MRNHKSMPEQIVVGLIATNCYTVRTPSGGAIVFDPGDEAPRIIAALDRLALIPSHIVLTHGHYDHLAGLPALLAHYAEKKVHPEIVIHKAEERYLGEGAYEHHCVCFQAATGDDSSFVDMFWSPLPQATRLVEEGAIIEQFKVLHVPGHSEGSIALYDEAAGVLISGDTLFRGGEGRTDLPGGDAAELEASLKRLCALPPDTLVYPGHGDSTTIQNEMCR